MTNKRNKLLIPGLSFSLKRALGIRQAKQKIAREMEKTVQVDPI